MPGLCRCPDTGPHEQIVGMRVSGIGYCVQLIHADGGGTWRQVHGTEAQVEPNWS
jgi:hypothetical protein